MVVIVHSSRKVVSYSSVALVHLFLCNNRGVYNKKDPATFMTLRRCLLSIRQKLAILEGKFSSFNKRLSRGSDDMISYLPRGLHADLSLP